MRHLFSRSRPWRAGGLALLFAFIGLSCSAAIAHQFPLTNDYHLIEKWTLDIGTLSDSSPALDPNGTVYFGTWKGDLWSVSSNGVQNWLFHAGLEIKSSPAIGNDGVIYFGSRDRSFYAVRPDGSRKWAFQTGGWVDASPALGNDGTVYFGGWDKNFYALNPDGSVKWKVAGGGEITSSPAIGLDGTIYFGSHDKLFYAMAPNGTKRWTFPTGGPITSSPALNRDQAIYFSSVDGYFYALNLDGTLQWRLRTGGISEASPVIGFESVIYIPVNEKLWAISREGKKIWERDFNSMIDSPACVFADHTIACNNRGGELIGSDEDAGFRWRAVLVGVGYGSIAAAPDGTLYTSGGGKFLRAFRGVPIAPTAWPKFRGNARNTGNCADNQR